VNNLSIRSLNRRNIPGRALVIAIAALLVGALVGVGVAFSSTGVTQPLGTYVVPGDAAGNPQAATLTATGFAPTQPVFVEQCDGTDPSSLGWDPTVNCDFGASPAPANADSSGTATFDVNDAPHRFAPFKGASPQDIFNCLAPHQLEPSNGLPSFRNCTLRFSSAPSAATGDQIFVPIQLPDAPAPAKAAGSCSLGTSLAKVTTGTPGAGLTDQTQDIKISSALLKDVHTTTPTILGGGCAGLVDSHYAGTGVGTGAPTLLGALTEKSVSLALSGAGSCAWNAPAVGADGSASQGYPLRGTLTIIFNELSTLATPYKVLATVQLTHNLDQANLWDLSGRVTTGLSVGATVSGTIRLDPVSKYAGTPANILSNVGYVPLSKPVGYTGYAVDTVSGRPSGCSDAVANNTSSAAVSNAVVVRSDPRNDSSTSTHTGVTVSSGSATVLDSAITAGAQGHSVTGTGVPANTTISSVTPGVSFVMNHAATANGTSVTIKNVTFSTGSTTVLDTAIAAADSGQPVSGVGVPAATTISSVIPGVSFVMNHAATANGTSVKIGSATVTSGSATVLDSRAAAADLHKLVTGAGIPANTFVGTVTPGVSFKLSSSDTTQVDVPATASGTLVNVTTTPARAIPAQTGILQYRTSSTGSGLVFSF
jgi:hypothetical protein